MCTACKQHPLRDTCSIATLGLFPTRLCSTSRKDTWCVCNMYICTRRKLHSVASSVEVLYCVNK